MQRKSAVGEAHATVAAARGRKPARIGSIMRECSRFHLCRCPFFIRMPGQYLYLSHAVAMTLLWSCKPAASPEGTLAAAFLLACGITLWGRRVRV